MNLTGNAQLSDSSRHPSATGVSGFSFDVALPDINSITTIIFDSTIAAGDQTFLQQQILGSGDLNLILQQWGYYGGYQIDATTYAGGRWMTRWLDPAYISYSIWFLNYDTTQYSLLGYQFREPGKTNVGQYYAPMMSPTIPGHYQIRWLYLTDNSSYGTEVIKSFTAVSRGIDAMRDYPYPPGTLPYPYAGYPNPDLPLVMTIPTYVYRNPGESATFTLQANGALPAPISYKWRFNGNYIADNARISGTNTNTLSITNLLISDGGCYTCIVSNQLESTKAYLVIDPP